MMSYAPLLIAAVIGATPTFSSPLLGFLPAAGQVGRPAGAVRATRESAQRPIGTKSQTYIYASSAGFGEIQVIRAGKSPKLVDTITQGLSFPLGLAVDKSGTLYAANNGNATVTEYPPGQNTPSVTLSQGLTFPNGVAIDAAGNVWVANGTNLLEYPPGSTSPSATLTTGLSGVGGVAVDAKGDLYVVNQPGSGPAYIAEIPAGGSAPTSTFGQSDLIVPIGITLDRAGHIYVGDFFQGVVYVYSPRGSHKLLRTITGDGIFMQPGGVAIDVKNNIYVGGGGNSSANHILEFPRLDLGMGQPTDFFNTQSDLYGVAADPTIEP